MKSFKKKKDNCRVQAGGDEAKVRRDCGVGGGGTEVLGGEKAGSGAKMLWCMKDRPREEGGRGRPQLGCPGNAA